MSQTMLIKLIIITNGKDLSHFLACGNFATCVAKVTYILFLAKNISLLAVGC